MKQSIAKELQKMMKIPFVSFRPMEKELDKELRVAFARVYERILVY